MAIIQHIIDISTALWRHDFTTLTDPYAIAIIYSIMFTTLFLENGLLPASFLPGDSLLLLAGVLISKKVINFSTTLLILTTAASLGYWLSYLQGRWLGNTRLMKSWIAQLPNKYHQRTTHMFERHGLLALLGGRFFGFVRTLLPTMAGISGLSSRRFQFFNWLSGLLWVGIIISLGYALNIVPFVKDYEDGLITFLILLPIILLTIGLLGIFTVVIKKKIL